MPDVVAARIVERYPGFLERLERKRIDKSDSTAVWQCLIGWVDSHEFAVPKQGGGFDAITFFARSGLLGERTVSYWAACDRAWWRRRPEAYPDFEDWRRAAASYIER